MPCFEDTFLNVRFCRFPFLRFDGEIFCCELISQCGVIASANFLEATLQNSKLIDIFSCFGNFLLIFGFKNRFFIWSECLVSRLKLL